jgi:hypothetical protein
MFMDAPPEAGDEDTVVPLFRERKYGFEITFGARYKSFEVAFGIFGDLLAVDFEH